MSFDNTDIDPDIMGGGRTADAPANETGNKVAESIGKNVAGTANAEASELIREFQKIWGPHYAALQNERLKKINELAAKDKYEVNLLSPTDEEFVNPITGKTERVFVDKGETKTYKRQKLNQAYFIKIEEMKAELQELDERIDKVRMYNKVQEAQAFMYLGMLPEDFRRCDWEQMLLIMLACTHRTRHGLPNSATNSNNSSTQAGLA